MFTRKNDAVRAARRKLGPEARESTEFSVYQKDGRFDWVALTGGPASETIVPLAKDLGPAIQQSIAEQKPSAPTVPAKAVARELRAVLVAERKAAPLKEIARRFEEKADPVEDSTMPEWPTSFVPDVAAGEIASTEYGMLTTRERAVEAAQAAGATDAKITQTVRGMWVWRTQQLDRVWKENAVADLKRPKEKREQPAALRKARVPSSKRTELAPGEFQQSKSPFRSNCVKAARRALGDHAKEGVDFTIEPNGGFWRFKPVKKSDAA